MFSAPPAIISAASPAGIARAAVPTASRPDPHSRLTVDPQRVRQSRQQCGHARDVAIVLARLVGAPHDHIVHRVPIDITVAGDERADRQRGQIVGAAARQTAAIATDRCANRVADESPVIRFLREIRC
jgi:hypothetical protein